MMYIFVLVVIIVIAAGLYQKNTNAICKSKQRLDGKTVIITGGTSGIGLEIATDLACRGARTIIACPFEDEGIYAKKQIIKKSDNLNVFFKYLDLSSLESVRTFANDILKTENRLDILVNNAGVGVPDDSYTKDGINFIMQVNYFGPFQLTLLLLALLKKSGQPSDPSRIINTSSMMHRVGLVDFENINKVGYYYLPRVYGNSKLCVVIFAHELTRRLQGSNVVVNSVDPGIVGTRIFESGHRFVGIILKYFCLYFVKTPWEGAQTALHVALDKEAGRVSGQYFKNCQISRSSPRAYSDKLAEELWERSLKLVKLSASDVM